MGPARHLEAAGIKNTTAAGKLAAVFSFYSWCVRRGHVRANPVADLDRQAVDYDTSATAYQGTPPSALSNATPDPAPSP